MPMTRNDFRKELTPGLNTIFGMAYDTNPMQWKEIVDIETSQKAYEEDLLVPGFGSAAVKEEGAAVVYDTTGEAYRALYQHETIQLAFALTQEAIDDNLYGDIGAKMAKALKWSMLFTKEVKVANILNNGFNSTPVGGDGKQLFSTIHPLKNGGTGANTLVTQADFSEASLEQALIDISNFVDDKGKPMAIKARKLIVPTALVFDVSRVLWSTGRTGTPDNDINAINKGDWIPDGYAVNQYLTDPDAWFIKTNCPDGLKHFVRKPLTTKMEGDFETDNVRYKASERYTQGYSDWRGAYGSTGI